MNKPTPTTHGAWRIVDGELIDESATPPLQDAPQVRSEPVSDTPDDAPPADVPQETTPATGRSKSKSKE